MNSHDCRSNINDKLGKVSVVLGAQFGDEGKGKVVDLLACNADVVCRYQACKTIGLLLFIIDVRYSHVVKYICIEVPDFLRLHVINFVIRFSQYILLQIYTIFSMIFVNFKYCSVCSLSLLNNIGEI
jgi:hypothetical protein